MLLLSFSSMLVFILLHFTNTHATIWDVKACYPQVNRTSVYIIFNKGQKKAIAASKDPRCFETTFKLGIAEKPRYIQLPHPMVYEAFVQNHYLQEMYVAKCQANCSTAHPELKKWVHWNMAVIHSKLYDNYDESFEIKPYGKNFIKFRANSKTTNVSFFLPMEMNTKSRIELLTTKKFWLDKTIKLKNMETSKIYSCSYLLKQSNPYHECSLRNDLEWKIELSSLSKLIKNIEEIKIFVGVTGSGTNSSQSLTFKKLAYLPTFSAFTNIGKIGIGEAEIYFKDSSKSFDISKIVLTKILTEEEYGCVSIHKTIPAKYSCKLQKSKNWLLKVISPEEHERNFDVEIIQDTLSSFMRNLQWNYVFPYGNTYIKYFNLKTYEKNEIMKLKFHFLDKFLRINEISLISNYSEYKFKTNVERKFQNYLVTEYTRITKEKILGNETNLSIKIDIIYSKTKAVKITCQHIKPVKSTKSIKLIKLMKSIKLIKLMKSIKIMKSMKPCPKRISGVPCKILTQFMTNKLD
ncbi:uncharacterized protein LOC106873066 isoform X2 [Octopus bimaculoides]|uniref:Vitellogenin domain-containing protein n=1 Tax=Octopus bimaculoides TaxID=37653 RepID=A0A0L8ID31_OCTBM|nr:uncharacterized protein LOC106873066 isoform X2 [Octopus bimaculoides]|eukprot:XP_014775780.1 PREDICTED: uncharacterized protein LOC106873066 isoform X2 [Octopus bimaculoides]